MYGVSVKITGVFGGEPSGVFGKYKVAFSSTLSRIGILTPQRRSKSAGGCAGDGVGVGDWAMMFGAISAESTGIQSSRFIVRGIEDEALERNKVLSCLRTDDARTHSRFARI